MLLPLLVFTI